MHPEKARPLAEIGEHGGVGSGQPGLNAKPQNFVEQRAPPRFVQMRRNLVQQQQRWRIPVQGEQPRMRQHDRDQQRLLDGQSTNGSGYFVLCGDAANTPNCDMDVSPNTNLIQNGADAVALFVDDASTFPNGTLVTTTNLADAIVYDTDDSDDAGLLVLLNAGQPQVNERGGGNGTAHSNQRCPNSSGGARNTDSYAQFVPTPGEANLCTIPVK